jgi:hypothetical protein
LCRIVRGGGTYTVPIVPRVPIVPEVQVQMVQGV